MRVLVTGASGFIGSVMVRQLVAQGHSVRCLVRETSDTSRINHLSWERVMGDVRDSDAVAQAISGCDAVAHLAGLSSWDEIASPSMEDVVVGGTRNLLNAALASGQPRTVVVSSSIAVNGSRKPFVHDEQSTCQLDLMDPRLVYARAKVATEQLCSSAASQGLPVSIVNPCEVYGPDDAKMVTAGNLADIAKSWPVLVCHGGTSVVHVEDVAAGIIAALERGRPGERYILGGDNLTLSELASLTLDILGRRKPVVCLPNPLILAIARAGTALRLPLPFNPAVIPYAVRYWFMDSRKAQRELGVTFRPARETLEPALRWLEAAGHLT